MIPSCRVGIVQSSYIPWRGAFALMARCERFVFLDSVQFTRRDWRTRNRIKTAGGPVWLTIPVKQKGNYIQTIDRMEIADQSWVGKHLCTIEGSYRRAPGFKDVMAPLRAAYERVCGHYELSKINQGLTREISALLGLKTAFLRDVDLLPREQLNELDPTERLAALAAAAGGTCYLSGPSARSYLDESAFGARGLAVDWMSYDTLEDYPQVWGAFEPAVSIVDTLLSLGIQGTQDLLRASYSSA